MSSSDKIKIVINGKFLSAGPTAVHKVAEEYTLAFDRMLDRDAAETRRFKFILAVPRGKRRSLDLKQVEIKEVGYLKGFFWEQLSLPLFARKAVLLNFCNLGPAFMRRAATLIHDVQAYTTPQSNSSKFRLLYKTLTPLICRFNRRILAVSNFSARELQPFLPAGKSVETVYNGCDHVLRVEPDLSIIDRLALTRRHYCVALANPKPHKNITILLEAFSDPKLVNVPLILFGPGSKDDFEKNGFVVPPQVRFAGRLSDGELVALIGEAGVLAFPSLTEGFGLPPLEAMALGCPVVIAPCGSLPEIGGDSALSADPFDRDQWARAISDLIVDANLSERMRQAGKARSTKFNWEASAVSVLKDAQEIIG